MTYAKYFKPENIPQSDPLPGREAEMTQMASGGYAFKADMWTKLTRFLMLGTEGGTFYEGEKPMTLANAQNVLECIAVDGLRVVAETFAISFKGEAPSNSPAIFVLALCASKGDAETRQHALAVMPDICRTGTHLFEFLEAVQTFRGWGRGLREGVAKWYTLKTPKALAYQVTKYAQRGGWSHRDVLRLSHAKPHATEEGYDHSLVFQYIMGKADLTTDTLIDGADSSDKAYLAAVAAAKEASEKDLAHLILYWGLPREVIPTEMLNSVVVWEALLEAMPYTAMMRNLPKMTELGMFDGFDHVKKVTQTLTNAEQIRKARVHPLAILIALKTYASGQSLRGSKTWRPDPRVVDALDAAFYAAFENVEQTDKNMLVMLDVSGSMGGAGSGWSDVSGVPNMAPREAVAAFAMVYVKQNPNTRVIGMDTQVVEYNISPRMRLDEVLRQSQAHGGTDMSAGFKWALDQKLPVDGFLMMTDGESWAGSQHVSVAFKQYHAFHPARSVTLRTTANNSSLNDPKDENSMEIGGFSPGLVKVTNLFVGGTI